MGIRYVHHICIQTDEYQKSLEFYTNILGFKVIKESKGFHGRDYNTWLELSGFMIELQTPKKDIKFIEWNKNNAGIVHMCLMVDDVQGEYRRIKDTGYKSFKVKNGEELYAVEGEYLFKVKAPEGTEVEFRDIEIK